MPPFHHRRDCGQAGKGTLPQEAEQVQIGEVGLVLSTGSGTVQDDALKVLPRSLFHAAHKFIEFFLCDHFRPPASKPRQNDNCKRRGQDALGTAEDAGATMTATTSFRWRRRHLNCRRQSLRSRHPRRRSRLRRCSLRHRNRRHRRSRTEASRTEFCAAVSEERPVELRRG